MFSSTFVLIPVLSPLNFKALFLFAHFGFYHPSPHLCYFLFLIIEQGTPNKNIYKSLSDFQILMITYQRSYTKSLDSRCNSPLLFCFLIYLFILFCDQSVSSFLIYCLTLTLVLSVLFLLVLDSCNTKLLSANLIQLQTKYICPL